MTASLFRTLMDAIIEECNIDGLMAYDLIVAFNSFEETTYKLNVLFKVLEKNNHICSKMQFKPK